MVFRKLLIKFHTLKLLFYIKQLSIDGKVIRWMKNRLALLLSGCLSLWRLQCSVLGPLLFIIYINDVDIELSNPVSKFAGDTNVSKLFLADGNSVSIPNFYL